MLELEDDIDDENLFTDDEISNEEDNEFLDREIGTNTLNLS